MSAQPKMDAFWMPYTSNKSFKAKPRLLAKAKDMYYYDTDGRAVMDTSSGLWCCNAGHCRAPIVQAIQESAATLDFAPTFHYGHPLVFEFAEKLTEFFPPSLDTIFLTNSGSEAVDSALKTALAYQRIRGKGEKQMLIGRERGYHGVGFGGISVGGMVKNKMWYSNQLSRVAHMPHTCDLRNLFSRGQPEHGGVDIANRLLDLIQLHDASTIAAVIVEPVAGSTGVLPPPKGYLQRLRQICDEFDILLIFDEVITAFGRLGKTTAAEYFGVTPDIMTFAKGSTSGTAPLGGIAVRGDIRQTFLDAADEGAIDFFHGYTYSGHPLSVAAGIATLNLYQAEGLMERGDEMVQYFEEAVHSLHDAPNVTDARNIGFMGALDLMPLSDKPVGTRAMRIMEECFHKHDLMVRVSGDSIALSPPLIMEKSHLDEIVEKLGIALKNNA